MSTLWKSLAQLLLFLQPVSGLRNRRNRCDWPYRCHRPRWDEGSDWRNRTYGYKRCNRRHGCYRCNRTRRRPYRPNRSDRCYWRNGTHRFDRRDRRHWCNGRDWPYRPNWRNRHNCP